MSMGSGGPISSVCRVRDSVSHVCYRIFDIIYQFSKLVFGLILHDILLTKGRIVFLTDYLTSSSKRIWGRKKKKVNQAGTFMSYSAHNCLFIFWNPFEFCVQIN